MEVKSGFKSTEFAFLVLFAVLSILSAMTGMIKEPSLIVVANAVIGSAYAIARGMAKQQKIAIPRELDKGQG